MLVDNANNADEAVRGTFMYQRQRSGATTWENLKAINPSFLKEGEGVRLELGSAEVLELSRALNQRYQLVSTQGIPAGPRDWVTLPCTPVTDEVRAIFTEPDVRSGTSTSLKARSGRRPVRSGDSLRVGDSLREKIDAGLLSSGYGIVVLSPHFVGRGMT